MYINWQLRELNLKIVYYGPAMSGKTTNLEKIYARVPENRRSDLVSLKTHEDRTLFFDFLQLELGKISGLTPKLQLYTVPGQAYYEASRKIVLRGADGIVFVADAAPNRVSDNLTAWKDMKRHLSEMGLPFENLPVVVQVNKQDLPGALSPEDYRPLLALNGQPAIGAIAIRQVGVFETLKTITQSVIGQLQNQARSSKAAHKPSPAPAPSHPVSPTTINAREQGR